MSEQHLNVTAIINNIKTCRVRKGYSQRSVAGKLALTQQAYSKIESGRSRIHLEFLLQLARVLEVGPASFFTGDDQ